MQQLQEKMDRASVLYSDQGDAFAMVYPEQPRIYLPLERFPDHLIKAVLAAEDKDFFRHPGISFSAILRAIWVNLSGGGIRQGASTITQQVARLFFLDRTRSYERKIREVFLAFIMESKLSKKQILELYLNRVFLGNHSYGFAVAARRYFAKSQSQLNLAEAALLAGLPQAPSAYAPNKYLRKALERQRQVLALMLQNKSISSEQYRSAVEQVPQIARPGAASKAPFYSQSVQEKLKKLVALETRDGQGHTIKTWFRAKEQKRLESELKFLRTQLGEKRVNGEIQTAGFVGNPATGHVFAELGSNAFSFNQFNRARRMKRNAGVASAPLLVGKALQRGYNFAQKVGRGHQKRAMLEHFCDPGKGLDILQQELAGPRMQREVGTELQVLERANLYQVADALRVIAGPVGHRNWSFVKEVMAGKGVIYRHPGGAISKRLEWSSSSFRAFVHGWKTCSHLVTENPYWADQKALGMVFAGPKQHNFFGVFYSPQFMATLWVGSEKGRKQLDELRVRKLFSHVFQRFSKTLRSPAKLFVNRRGLSWVPVRFGNGQEVLAPVPTIRSISRNRSSNRNVKF